ncbi:neutral zinc metallopeptidase [Mycobacterium yunnanensis]|uniref:Neutral zinc metallopeptidase n=1 Tax=Mycobacterium yunnanensis TaxID=368477 RepID=A0A9X3BWF1_9MYCO|nr:neutral zinc metallopeptidase [Mycobacterium yunnanensis]MCV7424280.1 neutral zinc metallopeptidase [Mycobacterium yunnanensis]
MKRRHLTTLMAVTTGALVLTSCTTTLRGTPVSVFANPFSVAGMPAVDGPTGLRDDAEPPSREVSNTDGGDVDELAGSAVSDIEEFWTTHYAETFDGDFTPVDELVSWDSTEYDDVDFCGDSVTGLVNAGYCLDQNTIGWDRGELLPQLRDANGDMAVTMVLAHEYGHSVAHQAGLLSDRTPTIVGEQQADCLAGVYMRSVAEGSSSRFTLSTGDGLNDLLAATIAFRDPLLTESDGEAGEDEHGSAFERVSAFQFGFTDGAAACKAIDLQEITQRRGGLPVLLPDDETGELPVTKESVTSIVDAMNVAFDPADPPRLVFVGSDCPDARSGGPASYCPATNTITVDLPALEELGAQSVDGSGVLTGDNTAYSVVVSRFMQAMQKERGGVALDDAKAALRTACLTGVATVRMTENIATPAGDTIQLTAGDVDEAVSGILVNGLAASDVNGDSVPSGFSRIDAFRLGVLGDQDRCFARFG